MPNAREKLIELFYDNNVRCDQKIEGLAEDVMDIIANGVTVEDVTDNNVGCKWISVKERLPEEDGRYLVHKNLWGSSWFDVISFAKDGRKVDEYDFHKNWKNVWYTYDSEWGHVTTDSVTHWMPLPQPPKGE